MDFLDHHWFIAYTILFIINVFGNSIAIVFISLKRRLHNHTNLLIGNMVFSDILFGTICYIREWELFNWFIITNSFWCNFPVFIQELNYSSAIVTMVFLAVTKYLMATNSLKWRTWFRTRFIRWLILGIWILSLLLSIRTFWYFELITMIDKNGPINICLPRKLFLNNNLWTIFDLLFLYLIPMICILLSYIYLLRATNKCANISLEFLKKQRATQNCEMNEVKKKQELKLTLDSTERLMVYNPRLQAKRRKLLLLMISFTIWFTICHLPYYIMSCIRDFMPTLFEPPQFLTLMNIARMTFYAKSSMNPIVLYLISEMFRIQFTNQNVRRSETQISPIVHALNHDYQ
ncbi:allatostatin-A receptor-like protein [Dinothrombium tinctorium]|uniref:Allatostatin-A receptor-like protein n=1 Tax=Dinothrombium tinctorium TaxID=1965070 RepID=A0A3S4QWZ7_9ACAR|nr:allatostatin-A receptor-like protein [Dinothrombium tinctorium]